MATRTQPKAARRAAPTGAKRSQSAPRRKQTGSFKNFIKDHRTHIALGIILVAMAFVMAISTVSHLKNGAIDQSVVDSGASVGQIADGNIQNVGGAFGAWLSHVLMTEGLGIGAFVLVYYVATLGLGLLGVVKCRFWSLTFKCLFSAIALSIIIGFITLGSTSFIHWGGVHGRYVNLWLMHIGSWPLAVAVTAALAGVLVAIYLKPISFIYHKVVELIPKRKQKEVEEDHTETFKPISLDEIGVAVDAKPSVTADDVIFVDNTEENSSFATGNALADNLIKIDEDDEDEVSGSLAEIGDSNRRSDAAFSLETVSQPVTVAPPAPAAPTPAPAKSESEPTFTIKETEIIESNATGAPANAVKPNPADAMPYDPRADLSRYVFPGLDLLEDRPSGSLIDPEEQQKNKDLIVKTLLDYKIPIQRIEATIGPTVTLYEIVPAEGVRIAQIQRLENDIALSLAALGIRIIAPIPGAGTVGIEVPNRDPKTVSIRSIIGSQKFAEACQKMRLPMAMGATISNDIFIQDLAKMPHLLVAGATGQGKSVGLNCIIASLLYAKHPSELKFVFIDPKMVEFAAYRKIERHFLAKLPDEEEPIITDPMKVPGTLSSLCVEMDNRYLLMSKANVRSVEEYNRKFCNHGLNPENGHEYMPYLVTIVDEFADLIMVGGKEVPMHIARIAQKGRAAGMHIIIATQRPSADVISGMIKNNFPGRIAFRVMSMVDSKTILDRPGANQLIGRGDMLFLTNGNIERVQCAFIDTPEIDEITDHINNQIGYDSAYLLPEPQMEGGAPTEANDPSKRDALFNDCARFIVTQSTASTSSLQRRFSIGYNKAGKIMDQMEAAGIVGAAQGAKPRAVLMDAVTLESIL